MADIRDFHGPNAGYVLDLYERYRQDPRSVDEQWRSYFAHFTPAGPPPSAATAATAEPVDIRRIVGGRELARAIRSRGHTAARLDPLGTVGEADPTLSPEFHGISEADLASIPAAVVKGHVVEGATNAAEAIGRLRTIYSGTIGYEFSHIPNPDERAWLRETIESGQYTAQPDAESERALLERLSQTEGLERYLHKTFFGQKRFSIEGNDMLVPMIDEIIEEAGMAGARDVVIGMAHRGRLNVLAHVLGKPYDRILAGFQGAASSGATNGMNPDVPSGDVKYHMGWQNVRRVGDHEVNLTLAPNPSHLEFVNPVVVGMTRAAQDRTDQPGPPPTNPKLALAILVHGDAAFPGQGVVAETLNLSCLSGYNVGGTIHLIANNQIGFTTDPEEGRSTRYASDLAKGFEVPIVHVNADDAEACLSVARLAFAYREQFHKDFVIDLVGYRRWGHNEGDEPRFTQPRMYEAIESHATVREQLAERLIERGILDRAEADRIIQATMDRLAEVRSSLEGAAPVESFSVNGRPDETESFETGVTDETLTELNEAMLRRPEGFSPNPRLERLLARRRDALGPDGGIDWGHAEALALASLLSEGTPIRLSGQDAERGTFSHRHLVLHDVETGEALSVLATLPQARASFEIYNSSLSEMSVVGFEYGYSVYDPQVLVLWEAQFGDFANGAQVIIDQFLAAAHQKWGQTSGLVLLLPHGYEGQGPEHSSARLERFLQLAAESNMRVVNCTTSAQYFHLLRRQAALLEHDARPLIVMSPKSLLRHPLAASRLEQLTTGSFRPVLADETASGREDGITRLLLCSGKVYVDLVGSEARERASATAVARVEELYPFPSEDLRALIDGLPALNEIIWVQEEPKNMGAWSYIEPRLRTLIAGLDVDLRYIGRPDRASPAEGSAERHAAHQARIVSEAWGVEQEEDRDEAAREPAAARR